MHSKTPVESIGINAELRDGVNFEEAKFQYN
jgi:hypothetical protein